MRLRQSAKGQGRAPPKRRRNAPRRDVLLEKSILLPILNACTIAGRPHANALSFRGKLGQLGGQPGPRIAADRTGVERAAFGAADHTADYYQSIQLSGACAGDRSAHPAAWAAGQAGPPAARALRCRFYSVTAKPARCGLFAEARRACACVRVVSVQFGYYLSSLQPRYPQ